MTKLDLHGGEVTDKPKVPQMLMVWCVWKCAEQAACEEGLVPVDATAALVTTGCRETARRPHTSLRTVGQVADDNRAIRV